MIKISYPNPDFPDSPNDARGSEETLLRGFRSNAPLNSHGRYGCRAEDNSIRGGFSVRDTRDQVPLFLYPSGTINRMR
jgi:hypothetical protein